MYYINTCILVALFNASPSFHQLHLILLFSYSIFRTSVFIIDCVYCCHCSLYESLCLCVSPPARNVPLSLSPCQYIYLVWVKLLVSFQSSSYPNPAFSSLYGAFPIIPTFMSWFGVKACICTFVSFI